MAGSRRALPLLLLLSSALGALLPPAAAAKVPLALYYESLCPYCSRFIVNHLAGIFDNGVIDAVELQLFPYGNAHVRGSNNTISCQTEYKVDEKYCKYITAYKIALGKIGGSVAP